MKEETLTAVVKLFKDFLDEHAEFGWVEDDLFDLETDLVTEVLKYEFPDAEVSYDAATYDEEETLLEVEWDVAKITSKISKKWTTETVVKKAEAAINIAIKSIKKNFKLEDGDVWDGTEV